MHEPTQLSLLETDEDTVPVRQVEYIAPDAASIQGYAKALCPRLMAQFGITAEGYDAEFIRGFGTFVSAIVQIQIRHLNKGVCHEPQTK